MTRYINRRSENTIYLTIWLIVIGLYMLDAVSSRLNSGLPAFGLSLLWNILFTFIPFLLVFFLSNWLISRLLLKNRYFVKVDTRFVPVKVRDIRYVKGFSEYIKIFVVGHRHPLVTLCSMSQMLHWLPKNFMQVHRSYIVNIELVEMIERSRLVLDSETTVVISDRYRESFHRFLDSMTLGNRK